MESMMDALSLLRASQSKARATELASKPKVKKIGVAWTVVHGGSTYGTFLSQGTAFEFANLLVERIRKECI
jgi:hypothetical protein